LNVKIHEINRNQIAEMQSAGIIIRNARDGIDLIGEMISRGLFKLILHERNVSPEFFELRTGIAGEVLQKMTNYKIRVCFVGEFDQYSSKSLQSFIIESNRGTQVNFVNKLETALERMSSTNMDR
jgi:hypothetical protein